MNLVQSPTTQEQEEELEPMTQEKQEPVGQTQPSPVRSRMPPSHVALLKTQELEQESTQEGWEKQEPVLASSVVTALAEQEARDAALARRLAGAGAAADLNRVLALSRETARAEQVARDATLARKMQAEEDARVASAPAPVPAPAPAPAGALPDGRIPVPPPSRAGDEAYEFALQAEREFAQRERARRPRRGIPVAALLYPWRLDG